MKKHISIIIAAILALTVAFSMAACGGSQSADTAPATDAPATETQTDAAPAGGQITADDVIFTYNGVTIELNGDAAAAVEALGEPNDARSQLSCHGEGEDKTYSYDGFNLNTYPKDDEDRVLEIVINGEGIATSKGIQIGDSADKVKETYGDGYREVGVYLAYDTGDGKSLQFFIEDGTVKEIDYYYDV